MKLSIFSLLVIIGIQARAEYFPFNHDVVCTNKDKTSVKISYDKKAYPQYRMQGEIQLELNSGFDDLANIAAAIGTDKPFSRVMRMAGPAGEVGNFLLQDEKDPFVVEANIGFETLDLIGENNQVEKSIPNFITQASLSRIHEQALNDRTEKSESHEYILFELEGGLKGYGHYFIKFEPSDCKTLN